MEFKKISLHLVTARHKRKKGRTSGKSLQDGFDAPQEKFGKAIKINFLVSTEVLVLITFNAASYLASPESSPDAEPERQRERLERPGRKPVHAS
jgi:hypothetical protein